MVDIEKTPLWELVPEETDIVAGGVTPAPLPPPPAPTPTPNGPGTPIPPWKLPAPIEG